MASSSVSQESLDITEDYELNARRSRIRTLRARGALPRGGDRDSELSGDRDSWDMNGEEGPLGSGSAVVVGGVIGDSVHDSPTRTSAAQRAKDKRSRPNHLQKGKLPKDKRKLREKRRSTGVVHLASTESTGDSLDDDLDEEKVLSEAKRNTAYNEVIDDDNPQTPSESKVLRQIQQFQALSIATSAPPRQGSKMFVGRRNKSPSDLEADLEDNQDYDSAVSQSDSNLTLIDHSASSTEQVPPVPPQTYNQSRYGGIDVNQSFKPVVSARESPKVSGLASSGQFSVLSNYPSKDSSVEPEQFKNTSQPKSPRMTNQTGNVAREPIRPVPSVLARYQVQEKSDDVPSYRSRFREREITGVRGPIGLTFSTSLTNKENTDDNNASRKMEKDLEREKDENRRLQKVLEDKDRRIAELERQVAMLNRDLSDYEDENKKLQIENRALIQAVGQLSIPATDV